MSVNFDVDDDQIRATPLWKLQRMTRAQVDALPYAARIARKAIVNTALARMTRAEVDALSDAARRRRREHLEADDTTLWGIREIAAYTGFTYSTVMGYRNEFLTNGGNPGTGALPKPDVEEGGRVRQPGDDGRQRDAGSPKWAIRTIIWWVNSTQRSDRDYVPFPEGRKPPGRPPKNRAVTTVTGTGTGIVAA